MYPSEPDMFSLAVTDAALFHMILCNSAAYVDVLSGDPQCLHTIVQKYEVIRHLQLELQSDVTVTDAWIATVASLVTLEVRTVFFFKKNDTYYIISAFLETRHKQLSTEMDL